MTHREGEQKVKAMQKAFLCWIEAHPDLVVLPPTVFNDLRRKLFRSTFDAFRLGVVGLNGEAREGEALWQHFFGWFENNPDIVALDPEVVRELTEECFRTTLEAFRLGAIVSVLRETSRAV